MQNFGFFVLIDQELYPRGNLMSVSRLPYLTNYDRSVVWLKLGMKDAYEG